MKPKVSILLLLLSFFISAAGQKLPKGTFILSTGLTYTEIKFKNKLKFEYKYSSCNGGLEGKGSYSFRNKELVLIFDNLKNIKVLSKPSIERVPVFKDSSYLTFKFTDQKDSAAIFGVIVKFLDKTKGITYGTQSNDSGFAKLKIKNTLLPLELEVNYISIDPQKIRIDSSGNYLISFPLNFDFIKPLAKGDTLRFWVSDFNNNELVLKSADEEKFRQFKRKSK